MHCDCERFETFEITETSQVVNCVGVCQQTVPETEIRMSDEVNFGSTRVPSENH